MRKSRNEYPQCEPGPPCMPRSNTTYDLCGVARSYPSLKYTPFRGFWAKKTPRFQPKSLILRSYKMPHLKQNAILFSLYTIKCPFCESEINCIKHFSTYIVFFIMSNIWILILGLMYEYPDENRQIHANCVPFLKISPIYAWKNTTFPRFREFAPAFSKLPLSSRKLVRAWYTFDRWGGGWDGNVNSMKKS